MRPVTVFPIPFLSWPESVEPLDENCSFACHPATAAGLLLCQVPARMLSWHKGTCGSGISDLTNETRVVRSSYPLQLRHSSIKPEFSFSPQVTIRTAQCVSRKIDAFL